MFSNLSEPERENIARGCRLRQFIRGSMVFRAGEQCESFHFVVSGQIKLFVASSTGVEKVIERADANGRLDHDREQAGCFQ